MKKTDIKTGKEIFNEINITLNTIEKKNLKRMLNRKYIEVSKFLIHKKENRNGKLLS